MSINAAVLGGIAYVIIGNEGQLPRNTQYLILLIGVVMILILSSFQFWQRRVRYQVDISNDRMNQIETELGVWRNRILRNFDEEFEKKSRNSYKGATYKSPKWWPLKKHFDNIFLAFIDYVFTFFFEFWRETFYPIYRHYVNRERTGRYMPPVGAPAMALAYFLIFLAWLGVILMSFFLFNS